MDEKIIVFCCFEVLEKVHAVDQEQHMSGMQWSGKRCSTGGWRVVVANKIVYGNERSFFFFFCKPSCLVLVGALGCGIGMNDQDRDGLRCHAEGVDRMKLYELPQCNI